MTNKSRTIRKIVRLFGPLPGTFASPFKFEEKGCSLGGEGKWRLTVASIPPGYSGSAEFELELSEDRKRAEGEFDVTIHFQEGVTTDFHCKVELFVREGKDKNCKVKPEAWAKVTETKEHSSFPVPWNNRGHPPV
jgi:hypothetical protein